MVVAFVIGILHGSAYASQLCLCIVYIGRWLCHSSAAFHFCCSFHFFCFVSSPVCYTCLFCGRNSVRYKNFMLALPCLEGSLPLFGFCCCRYYNYCSAIVEISTYTYYVHIRIYMCIFVCMYIYIAVAVVCVCDIFIIGFVFVVLAFESVECVVCHQHSIRQSPIDGV